MQAGAILVGSHEQVLAEPDARRGARNAAEQEPGGHRESQHPHQCFDRRHHVGRHAVRPDVPIPHRAERVRAEEKRVHVAPERSGGFGALKLPRPEREVDGRKDRISDGVAQDQRRQKSQSNPS